MINKILAFATVISAVFFLAVPPALAQGYCMSRDVLVERLRDKFREVPSAAGLSLNGQMVELFSSPSGLTWTLAATTPSGISCLIASGEAWNPDVAPVPVAPKSKGGDRES